MGLSHIAGILMENGADPLATDALGATALHYAVSSKQTHPIPYFIITVFCVFQAMKNHEVT